MSRLLTLLLLLCAWLPGGRLEAQKSEPVPPHLMVTGDPATRIDLGATRFVPIGRREDPSSPVTRAAYVCRATLLKKLQEPAAGIELTETLLGRSMSAVLPYLNKLSPEKQAHVVSTRHATVVGLLGKARVKGVSAEEWARLRVFFPDLKVGARELSGLQRTHLWVTRLLQNQAALADLLDLDENQQLKPLDGRGLPVAHRRFEMYLFESASEHDSFRNHIFEADTEPLVGALIRNVPVPVPASAVLLHGASPEELRRRFVFSAALLSLTRHRRLSGGLPPWLMLGVAHFMERRLKTGKPSKDGAGTLPGMQAGVKNWDAIVRDMVIGKKSADIVSLTAAGHDSMTVPMRIQSCSMVRFMVGAGPGRFSKMMRMLYNAEQQRTRVLAINDAVGLSYNVELRTLEKSWRRWVSKTR